MYRELAKKPEPTPRSWWQCQNWACRLGLHALKKKYFEYWLRQDSPPDRLKKLQWWNRSNWSAYADREYARCTRDGCSYATVLHLVWYPYDKHKDRLTHENQLPPSLRRKKLLK